MLLEAGGHLVDVEHDSHRALERARQQRPDVALLDIGLPEMDGNELARRLRADPQTRAIVLVAVTGYGQEQDRRAAFEAGFDHHLVKPVDMDELTRLLAEIEAARRGV
jgi:CheY-like chemotaxis protein